MKSGIKLTFDHIPVVLCKSRIERRETLAGEYTISRLTNIAHTTRYSHDFLHFSSPEQWKESEDGFENTQNINVEALLRVFEDGLRTMFAVYNAINLSIQNLV